MGGGRLLGKLACLVCGVWIALLLVAPLDAASVPCSGPAQRVSGSIEDVSGALVPFAKIEARCGRQVWKAQTDEGGNYTLVLPPGDYTIEASAPGYSRASWTLHVAGTEGQESKPTVLAVGSTSSSVTVTAKGGVVATMAPTSTKSNTPLLEQPFAIDVVPHDALVQQNPQSMVSALSYTAGVEGLSANGPAVMAVDAFNLRGNDADEYLDGMRIPQSFNAVQSGPGSLQLDPYDLERIDILLGPSSTLYGQSNLGGIVDAVSKLPVPNRLRSLQLQTGSFGRYQGAADFSGPLTPSGKFLYRADGIVRRSDTFVYGMRDNRVTLNPTFSWLPSANTRLDAYGKYLRNSSDSVTSYLPVLGTVEEAPYGYLPVSINSSDPRYDRYRKNQFMAGYSLSHRSGGAWSVRHQLRYVHMNANMHFLFLVALMPDGVTGIRSNYLLLPTMDGIQSDTHAGRTLRTGPVRHTLLGGVDFQWQGYRYDQGFGMGSNINLTHPIYGQGDTIPTASIRQRQTQFQGGLYGQDEASISHFTLVAGGRVDFTSQDTFDRLTHAPVSSQSPHAFSGHGGVSYHIDGFAPYFSYSTSFLPTLGANLGGKPYVPVTGSNIEGGVKYQPRHSPLMLRASGFSMREQNVLQPDPTNPINSLQTGEVHTPGFDLQANGAAFRGLDYIVAFTHIHPENSVSTFYQGKQPVAIANNTASAWLHYTAHHGRFAGAGIGAGVRDVGSSWATPKNDLRVPGFTLFDAGIDYTLERWRFAVNARNIRNRRFVNGCSGTAFCSYGASRTVIGTATFHF